MTRYLATAAIVVAGICTTAMNWRFSYQLGTSEIDSVTWAVFSVALDVLKWLMLPYAALAWKAHKLRAVAATSIWLVATIYSFTAAIGFAALNRDATAAERQQQVELHKTVETMKRSPRWLSSAACADATAPQSKQFCATYRDADARLKSLPQDADPQSALLSRLTGLQPNQVRLVLSLFLAAACEVVSALGFFAILPPAEKPPAQTKTAKEVWRAPAWRDAGSPQLTAKQRGAAGQAATGRDGARHGKAPGS